MSESTWPLIEPRTSRRFTLAGVLKLGSSPIPTWIAFAMALFVTVSAFDDVRLILGLENGGSIAWWRLASAVTSWAVWIALAFLPQLTAPLFVLMLIAIYPNPEPGGVLLLAFGALSVCAYRVSTRGLVIIVGSFLVWQLAWVPLVSGFGIVQLWGYLLITLLLVVPGLVIKLQREKNLQADRMRKEMKETAAKVALSQRAELARELHDVVTHGLTMIAVQANLGTLSKDDDAQQHALTEIGSMARSSLDDLRRLLQTMRANEPALSESGIQTNVEESAACIDLAQGVGESQKRLNNLGVPTRVSTSGDLESTPNGLRSTVMRILQESATNVVRHTGGNSECNISMDVREDRIEVLIRNRMTPGKPRLPVSGTGLVGLRERVARLDGTIEAGPVEGWWSVSAVLPFARRQTLR